MEGLFQWGFSSPLPQCWWVLRVDFYRMGLMLKQGDGLIIHPQTFGGLRGLIYPTSWADVKDESLG